MEAKLAPTEIIDPEGRTVWTGHTIRFTNGGQVALVPVDDPDTTNPQALIAKAVERLKVEGFHFTG